MLLSIKLKIVARAKACERKITPRQQNKARGETRSSKHRKPLLCSNTPATAGEKCEKN